MGIESLVFSVRQRNYNWSTLRLNKATGHIRVYSGGNFPRAHFIIVSTVLLLLLARSEELVFILIKVDIYS